MSKLGLKHTPQIELQGPIVDELLGRYLYDADLIHTDCENVLKFPFRPGYDLDKDRILAIRSHRRFLAWLELNEPSVLLLNANSDPATNSEMSFVSAKLYQHILKLVDQEAKSTPTFIPLIFFCGQHRDYERDENGTPSELAMSLLLQLLDAWRGFTPDLLAKETARLDPETTESVCDAFGSLISSLPPHAIVILIVDGLRYFAQPSVRRQEMIVVVESLVGIHRQGSRATLKFLFANSARCEYLENIFMDEEYLRIRKDGYVVGGGGHIASAWNLPDPAERLTPE